jgi:Fuc2NAc and GlcNAc transferase
MLDTLTGCALAATFVVSCVLTFGMRRYALAAQLLDHPNDRSSHSVPTPRGGGVAIVLASLLFLGVSASLHVISRSALAAFLGGGAAVALAGLLDDHVHLSARSRFLVHLLAAVWVLGFIGPLPRVPIFGAAVDLGWLGLAVAVAYMAWMVNLYNFMDGIDGLAGIEGVSVFLSGALCWWLSTRTSHWPVPVAFAAAVAGFLVWNYPPARIFMGDSGSGFVGFTLGATSLWSALDAPSVFWCWFILIGCFMVDATTTLIRRVRRGERFYEAHRSHAYQYASRVHGSHKAVSLGVGAINVAWLLPWAALVALGRLDGVAGSLIAYTPLVWLAYHYKAGDGAAQAALAAPRK